MSWGKGGGDEVRGGVGGLTGYCGSFGSHRKVLSRGMTCPDLGFKRDSLAGASIEVGRPVSHGVMESNKVKCQGLLCE